MKNRRPKLFLTAWTNMTQAQCLNARALVQYLDKDKINVGAMVVYSGDLPVLEEPKVKYFRVRYPARIWALVQLLRGIFWADIIYVQNPGRWKLVRWLLKVLRKKSFGTVEGVYTGIALERGMAAFGGKEGICAFHSFPTKSFSITKAMVDKNREAVGLQKCDGILYLGTEFDKFAAEKTVKTLEEVVIIGADLKRKGIADYIELAKRFPQVKFHVAGGSVGGIDYKAQCEESGLSNIVFHGPVSHAQLKPILAQVQLHVFPSRAEGFPKVTLETAAAGVPSVVYDDYGADEWIETGKNGFVVKTLDEMAAVIQGLLDYPERLQPIADGAREMARRFDWRVLVRDWEREILSF